MLNRGEGQDESSRLEFIDCPHCGRPVLKIDLSRQWNEWGEICWCESDDTFDPECRAFKDTSGIGVRAPDAPIATRV